jgi:hypothetical protein
MATNNNEHYSVYVLCLHRDAGTTKKMRRQNAPNVAASNAQQYLYVGCTGLDVLDRMQNHLDGYKSCNLVRKYFTGNIFTDYDEYGKKYSYADAIRLERDVAQRLRVRGFAVYQN